MLIQLKKLKRALLKENRFGRYLLYATGEIILVVVGILIALQVNNFNVQRQANAVESEYYLTIKKDVLEDKALLGSEIKSLKNRKQTYMAILNEIQDPKTKISNGLGHKIFQLIEYGDFRRKSSVYQTLVSSGEIKLIKNKAILTSLQDIERSYNITERLETTMANLVLTYTAPKLFHSVDFGYGEIFSKKDIFSNAFTNGIYVAIKLIDEKIELFDNAIKITNRIVEQLDVELAKS